MEKKTNKSSFIKHNGQIIPKPEGLDYSLVNGKVYSLVYDREVGGNYLIEDKDFEFPTTYYLDDKDNKFISRTINTFQNTAKMTTGILLSGLKGSGKTLMAKKIAKESGLPIIVIDPKVCADEIEGFFQNIDTEVCIIFDEIDKYWNTRYLLSFFDGVKPTCKKIVICTCNDEKEINNYLNDRCSRIRYKKTFDSLNKEAVAGVINDVIKNKDKSEAAAEYICSSISTISYDNVVVFAEELKNNPDDSFDDIVEFLNISKR